MLNMTRVQEACRWWNPSNSIGMWIDASLHQVQHLPDLFNLFHHLQTRSFCPSHLPTFCQGFHMERLAGWKYFCCTKKRDVEAPLICKIRCLLRCPKSMMLESRCEAFYGTCGEHDEKLFGQCTNQNVQACKKLLRCWICFKLFLLTRLK